MPCLFQYVNCVDTLVQKTILLKFHEYIFPVCLGALSGNRCPRTLNCIISPHPLHEFSLSLRSRSFTADISSVGVEHWRVP